MMNRLIGILLSWLVVEYCCLATTSTYVLDKMIINTDSLSITSYQFNVNSKYSDWIDKIFGRKSVFFSKTESNQTMSSPQPFSFEEAEQRYSILFRQVTMPAYAYWPKCSIEMLGYVMLESDSPFKMIKKNVNPMLGTAMLTIGSNQWSCFYRPLYENWRNNIDSDTSPNFWAVVFYCPTIDPLMCGAQRDPFEQKEKLSAALLMQHPDSKSSYWRTEFVLRKHVRRRKRKTPTIAVCTSMPYLTADRNKEVANGALFYDWTRYYLNLGVQVIIYDRDGNHRDYLFNNPYATKQLGASTAGGRELLTHPNLVYHNHTILGLLDNKSEKGRYDNTEGLNDYLIKYDNDHALTLTQCRFEAKALLGIDTVIVSDFDEFLYCPAGGSSPTAQAQYQRNLFRNMKSQGVDQMSFYQRMLANRTSDTPRDCAVKHALDQTKGTSVFDCFAPSQYTINEFLLKSVHLNHGCPLTGDHLACPLPDRDPRSHDCMCESVIVEDCSMYHLSTRVRDYEDSRNTKHAVSLFQGQISELYLIANNIRLGVNTPSNTANTTGGGGGSSGSAGGSASQMSGEGL